MDERDVVEAVDDATEAFFSPGAWASDKHPRDEAGRFAKGTGLSPETVARLRDRARARMSSSKSKGEAKRKREGERLKRSRIGSMVRQQFEGGTGG